MITFVFAKRNAKEISRDKISLIFGIVFPVILLLLLSFIQSNIPGDEGPFAIEKLAPGMAIFGLSFISLFSGLLISKDRNSSFMMRLMSSPMKAKDFILGYILPLIPMALLESIGCFVCALFLGLQWNISILYAIIASLPAALLFIGIGLLCGSLFNEKQVGGACGALLTNVSAWLSGIWFDVALVGGWFETIANLLPFVHAVNVGKLIIAHDYTSVIPELLWVIGYAIVIIMIAIYVFMKKTQK
ncbi:ABC transporter permease [Candidatus Stoquefichus massiliensis]|uniref:ABC transporter permease n=1 Tax=Candidatus Stoquefichus massiliensis TaxID=1470350 RepID=UPI0004867581|nr:ABC transporter permease [Candidatus Stoquefichus massiliensis]